MTMGGCPGLVPPRVHTLLLPHTMSERTLARPMEVMTLSRRAARSRAEQISIQINDTAIPKQDYIKNQVTINNDLSWKSYVTVCEGLLRSGTMLLSVWHIQELVIAWLLPAPRRGKGPFSIHTIQTFKCEFHPLKSAYTDAHHLKGKFHCLKSAQGWPSLFRSTPIAITVLVPNHSSYR